MPHGPIPRPARTPVEAMAALRADGLSIAEWARGKGFSARLVYQVLGGHRKCLRGESFQIAKELGMK
jgi:gp16 family phage-associated protein